MGTPLPSVCFSLNTMDDVCSLPGHVEQVLEHVDDMNGFGVVVHRPRRKPVTEEKKEKGNNYNNILRCIKKKYNSSWKTQL